MNFQLRIVSERHNQSVLIQALTSKIRAKASYTYTLLDSQGQVLITDLVLSRIGNNLEIEVAGELVTIIEEFYAVADSHYSLEGLQEHASANIPEDLILTSGGDVVIEEGLVWEASGNSFNLGAFELGLAGLGIGAIGAIGSGSSANEAYSVTVTAAAGIFAAGVQVEIYDQNGGLLESDISVAEDSSITFIITDGYVGPVLVKVSDINGEEGDYVDETSGELTSLGTSLRAMTMVEGSSNVSITVSPLTELAVTKADIDDANPVITEADIAINDSIGELFGVENIIGPVVTVLDDLYQNSDGLSAEEVYGNALALLSGVDTVTGSLEDTLIQLTSVITLNDDGTSSIKNEGLSLLISGVEAFESSDNADEADIFSHLVPLIVDGDNTPPKFTSENTATAIDENSGAGQVVYTAISTDTDDISIGNTRYSLSGTDAELFNIDAATGAVTLTANPDYETQNSYNFDVIATDTAGNSASETVALDVNNLDEVAPSITSGNTATAIDENSGAGQVVYTITSTDTDDISTGMTSYSLSGTDAALFGIDSSTGEVTLLADPDYETQNSYNFDVIATDTAGYSATETVALDVNNLDEVAPKFTLNIAVDENSGANQVIYTATTIDTDDISTGMTSYSLSGTDAELFNIDAATGAVTLTANPDYETQNSYNFDVIATDTAGNSASETVALDVNNLDEVAPSITSGNTATAIDENSGAGQVVYTITSTDTDDISTGMTSYSLSGTDAALFGIDSSTGEVTLLADPDYETQSSYCINVVAIDAAGNRSAETVILGINNIDEVAPSITSGNTATAIDENSGAGQVVYTITSTDTDDISTGMTSYSLSGTDAALFGIDSSTGEVTLLADPDYETQSSYCINVVAIDAAGNRSAETVILGINNIDEVAPSITSGNTATAIDENSGAGQVVYTITSTDTDDISTGMTSYSLSGTDAALFGIDSSTGEVTLLADPDYETQSSYCINVVAIDAAGNRSAETVILGINNIDEAILITPSFELFADTGSSGIDGITNDATVNVSDIGAGAIWQYSLDGGINWAAGISNSFELSADTTYGAGSIQVRGINSSGDVSEASQNYGVITVDNTAPLGSLVSTPFYLDTYFYTNTGVGRPQVSSVGSDGAYVVTWSVEYTDNILVQLFAADGTPSGDAVKLEGNNNTADNNFYPQVSAVGSDGAYVVTWYGKNSDGGYDKDYSNFVQLFAADGSTNGDVVELQVIGGTSYNDDYSGQVSAVGNDGTYVVTWVSHNGDYYDIDERVFVQLFAADGTVNGDAVQLETTSNTTGRASSSQVSGVGSDGAYVVIWSDRDSEGDNSIFVQLFTADGSISGDSLQLEAVGNTSGGDVLAQVSAVGSDGAYVVTWRGEDSEGDSSIFVQQFAVDGTLSGDSVQLEAVGNTTGSDSYPQVRAVGVDGAYVVTWSGEDSEGNTSIFVQQFAIDGSTDDDAVQLEATGNVYGSPQVSTVGSDGAYVVTWSGGSGVDDSSIFVQRFAANGSTVGEAVQLDSTGSDFTPQVSAVGNDGAYVVVWTGAGNGWDDYNILVQLFDAEGRPVVSTLLNDNQSIDVQSSEVGTAYLVSALIDVSSLHDITELDDTSYNSVAITSVDTATGLSSSGLADGTYFAYVADVAGNLSQIDQVIIIDSAANSDIEVFDLVSGQSSNLLTRTFEVEVSYDLSLTTESGKDSVSYDENLVLSEDDAINFVSDGSFNGELLGSDANVNFYATKFIEEEQTEFWLNTQNLVSDLNYINTHIVGGSLTSQGLA